MEDPIHLLIVGHCLQAKCDVANAFIKRKNAFKQFSCRQNVLIKRIVGAKAAPTVAGRPINVVLTPNLNSPGWTHLNDGIMNRYQNKVFIYVQASSEVNVNDVESVKNIKTKFKSCYVYVLRYFSSANELEKSESNTLCLHKEMPLQEKISTLNQVLTSMTFRKDNLANPGDLNLDTNVSPGPYREGADATADDKALELGQINERHDTCEFEQEEINADEWNLLAQTLKHGNAKSNHVRVNFVGNQGAGKTTIILRLRQKDVKCPDEQQKPTEALEISEISSRCIEVDGEKHWETDLNGYGEELNIQRMAQAMTNVQKGSKEKNSCNDMGIENEDFETNEYQVKSSIEEDTSDASEEPYSTINKDPSRIQYMKNILRKKKHSSGEKMYVSYWDFAGQSTYYSTHQVFLSPSAVYVLVVDLSKDFKEKLSDSLHFRSGIIRECSIAESLMFWISSIKSFTTDSKGGTAPVIIVGTHVDKVRMSAAKKNCRVEVEINRKFNELRQIIGMSEVECVAIDNTSTDKKVLDNLRDRILELGLGVIDEEIPAQWIDLERRIQENRLKGTMFMKFTDMKRLDESMDFPMKDESRLRAFLGHQHNRGHLIHFPHDELRDLIILDPDVLAKFLNNLMRGRDQKDQRNMDQHTRMYNYNGIINYDYILEAAKLMSEYKEIEETIDTLVNMLIHLSVIRQYKSDEKGIRYLLPCLLPHEPDALQLKTTKATCNGIRCFQIVFPENHMPPSFFHVLIGGLLNEWKLIERSFGKPEIYNLYACFRLDTETHQMEIFWRASYVYINIYDYSKSNKLTESQIFDILEILEKRIEVIFQVYRQTNKVYEIRVQCPRHQNAFVSLTSLKKEGEAMCYGDDNDVNAQHAVEANEVFGKGFLNKKMIKFFKRKPTDADLGRLATLLHDDPTALAARLQLLHGNIEADRAALSSSRNDLRRLHILIRWRLRQRFCTIMDLLELLTATKDYQRKDLEKRISSKPERQKYDIANEKLDCIPNGNQDINVACSSIGVNYPFLMLELGLPHIDILEAQENNPRDMRQIIFTLLEKWRNQNPRTSTTRALLDTCRFVGIDTTTMQKKIAKR